MICYGNDSSKKYFIWRDNTKLIFKNIMLPFLASKIENWKCTFFFVLKHVVLQDIKKFLRLGLLGCISIRFHLKHCDIPELTAWLQDCKCSGKRKGESSFFLCVLYTLTLSLRVIQVVEFPFGTDTEECPLIELKKICIC